MYDYEAGKSDWLASGFPVEGRASKALVAGHLAEEVATCRLEDPIGEVRRRAGEHGPVVVTSKDGIVFGRLTRDELGAPETRPAEEVMDPAPVSTRYDESATDLIARMQAAEATNVLVTAPTGRLIGNFARDRAEAMLHRHGHRHSEEQHDG